MVGDGGTPLSKLAAAVREFQARELDPGDDDPKRMRTLIDALEGEFSSMVRRAQQRGDHLVNGNITAASWISRTCGMSVTSVADRLCVGEQLESLPKIAAALSSGEIGYQSASVLCHLREQLAEKRDLFNEDEMLGFARQFSAHLWGPRDGVAGGADLPRRAACRRSGWFLQGGRARLLAAAPAHQPDVRRHARDRRRARP